MSSFDESSRRKTGVMRTQKLIRKDKVDSVSREVLEELREQKLIQERWQLKMPCLDSWASNQ